MTKVDAGAPRDGASPAGWLGRPLCRRYVLGIFDGAVVRSEGGQGGRDRTVHWATGWLADGECEFLGAWIEPEESPEGPPRMLADLKRRGVERIWHVAGTDAGGLRERVSAAFPGSTPGSSGDRLPPQALATAPEHVAAQVRQRLKQGIRRHGSFESGSAVLDFLARALQRTERRMDRGGMTTTVRLLPDSGTQRASPGF